jgi:uncharacterized LabA/DUF88 family protein
MTRTAILIDGGFFLKRLRAVQPGVDAKDPVAVSGVIERLIENHLALLFETHAARTPRELLYRAFWYDARPFEGRGHLPVTGKPVNWAGSNQARFRKALFDQLRKMPDMAVRLGETVAERQWVMTDEAQQALLTGKRDVASLTDQDFTAGIRQKAVDMRLGLDIASITLKRQADMIVLVTGDSDFVPAAKLARREGVRVILDPLWQSVRAELFEHIDLLRGGFPKPGEKANHDEE